MPGTRTLGTVSAPTDSVKITNGVPYQTPAVSVSNFSSPLPLHDIDPDVDHEAKSAAAVEGLAYLDESKLLKDAVVRDLYALTGTTRTFYGAKSAAAAWKELGKLNQTYDFALVPGSSQRVAPAPVLAWVQADFTFKTRKDGFPSTECYGTLRIVPDIDGEWKILAMTTFLESIEGMPNVDHLEKLSSEQREKDRAENGPESGKDFFDCAIVGGGHSGLSIAGRFKAVGLSHVCLEKNDEIGGNWLNRYESFKLHTTRETMHLPFSRQYAETESQYMSSKEIARGYQRFVDWYAINIWLSSAVDKAEWNEDESIWTITITHHGQTRTLRAHHLIFAVGAGGQVPYTPDYPGRETLQGEALHSVAYKNARPWAGKRGVIVGCANTGHDVAEDMLDAGLSSVTMVQRSPTMIFPMATYKALFGADYLADTDIAAKDRETMGRAVSIVRPLVMAVVKAVADTDPHPQLFDALEQVGFRTERYPDPFHFLSERLGGHYFEVGASAKVAAGLIKTHSGHIASYTPSGLAFTDGSTLDADVIVWCTGFEGNMRDAATRIVGEEVGSRLENYWKLDREGEIIGLCKPMVGQRNVWYVGGDVRTSRYFSRFMALLVKADLMGKTVDVYRDTPGVD